MASIPYFPSNTTSPIIVDPLVLSELPQPSAAADIPQLLRPLQLGRLVRQDERRPAQIGLRRVRPSAPPSIHEQLGIGVAVSRDRYGPGLPGAVLQLRGIVLHSRLLKLSHVICCPRLSQFVQQFLTRLVLAYPERATLWYALPL
jgi:hypothetical protein